MKAKLKASTLIESIIAMVILTVCFGIGTMIYSNVLDSDKQRQKLKAILILNNEASEIKKSMNFIDSERIEGDYLILSFFERQAETENLYKFCLQLKDKEGTVIAIRNELIITRP